jgi:hypothetical protein
LTEQLEGEARGVLALFLLLTEPIVSETFKVSPALVPV